MTGELHAVGIRRPAGLTGLLQVIAMGLLCASPGRAALEDEVRAYEARDALQPPPADAILFVGSSSIKGWTNLAASFPGHPVLNRGFGGSQMSDLLAYFDRLVVPYAPPLMVVYEGDNDLASAKTVEQVFADYMDFARRVEHRLPESEVIFVAVKPSPSRLAYLPKMAQFNALLEAFCASRPHFRFADVSTPMLNDQGQPRPELFQSDQLHMVAAGYEVWTAVIGPVLDAAPFLPSRHFLIDLGAATSPTPTGPAPADPVNAWNTLSEIVGGAVGGELPHLRATDGTVTNLGLQIVSPFAGVNENGSITGPLFPESAARDSLYGHEAEFAGRTNILPSLRLTGLNPVARYQLSFFGSRSGVTDNRETLFTVTGAATQSASADASNNQEAMATVRGIVPDEEGSIMVTLAPGPANTSPQRFVYLNVLHLEEQAPQAAVSFLQEPDDVTAELGQPAVFDATLAGPAPLSIQWYRDGEPVPDATSLEYQIPAVTAEMHNSLFQVRVAGTQGEIVSRQARLQVVADTTPPSPQSATTTDGVQLEILFSEALDPTTLEPPTPYAVHGGLVPVLHAALQPDGRTLVLTLAHRVTGSIQIEFSQLRDLSGNPLSAGTAITFEAPIRQPRTFLLDFGAAGSPTTRDNASGHDPIRSWNNVTSVGLNAAGRLDGLITTQGETTGAGLAMISRFNGANESGTTSATAFPANATRDSLFGNTESFNGQQNVFPRFKLTGLDPGTPHVLTFFASRTGVNDNRETGYTVDGATSGFAALNAANNLATTALVAGILPTSQGEITISLAPTPANTNANHFTYLGVLQVAPTEVLALATPRQLSPNSLVLDWTGSGVLEWSDNLTMPAWNPITPTPTPPWFEDISQRQRRFFRLRPAP